VRRPCFQKLNMRPKNTITLFVCSGTDNEKTGSMTFSPVDAVTVEVEAVDDEVGEKDDGQVATVEVADGLRRFRKEFGERSKPTAVLRHGQRVQVVVVRPGDNVKLFFLRLRCRDKRLSATSLFRLVCLQLRPGVDNFKVLHASELKPHSKILD
jgi:hypothetical protein